MEAALRDASFYRTHRHTTGRSGLDHIPCYHVVSEEFPFLSRCGRYLDTASAVDAAQVVHRCQRNGCKQAWGPVGGEAGQDGGTDDG